MDNVALRVYVKPKSTTQPDDKGDFSSRGYENNHEPSIRCAHEIVDLMAFHITTHDSTS